LEVVLIPRTSCKRALFRACWQLRRGTNPAAASLRRLARGGRRVGLPLTLYDTQSCPVVVPACLLDHRYGAATVVRVKVVNDSGVIVGQGLQLMPQPRRNLKGRDTFMEP